MGNIGILYFSSTGNSLYIAKKIRESLGGSISYIPAYGGNCEEFDTAVIVTPVYSFGLPVPTLDLFDRIDKTVGIIVVLNYGGMVGGADRLCYEYAVRRGLNIKSVYAMKMPENYTLVMSPPAFYGKAILKSADKRIDNIVDAIRNERYVIPRKKRIHERTYLKNKSNWHLIAERFSVSDSCVKCGKCVSVCPVNNVRLTDGKVTFGDGCIACLGCFHRCPKNAIVYMNKPRKKQYFNPNVDESELGRDLSDE